MAFHTPDMLPAEERLRAESVVTGVYLTVDTELSVLHYRRHGAARLEDNFAMSILGRTPVGDFGIVYQMERLDAFGLKGAFFVDPLVALVAGPDMVKRIVDPILSAGHDVQLHAHAEWLGMSPTGPTDGRGGENMGDFGVEDQVRILGYGVEMLVAAGAPVPVAFRAGNYGASDDTLRALARLGLRYDSSYSPDYGGSVCRITMPAEAVLPFHHEGGIIEVPVSAISSPSGGSRHAQITALSAQEMIAALAYAAMNGHRSFTIVSHSFELLSRQRDKPNRIVVRRFDRLCEVIAASPRLRAATYAADPPEVEETRAERLPHSLARTLLRQGEQAVSNGLYGEQIGAIPAGAVAPAMKLREQLIAPLHNLGPLQQIALDILMAV